MVILGHIIVFFLAASQQYMWRAQGGRNSVFSALFGIVVAIGGVVFLGWWAVLTILAGMILGAVVRL